ncbi:MAG: neuromedin U [Betaproteobacteria bacterium]
MTTMTHGKFKVLWAGVIASSALLASPAHAELSAEELAKIAQNPVGAMVSVPFQNNTNFNVGPQDGTQNILSIQPVIPVTLNNDWNLITRTILPLIWQPGFARGQGSTFGLGDIQFSGMLSPSKPAPGGLIWGVGAIAQLPTNTSDVLGNGNWGLGPQAVVLHLEHGDPWVYGALINNVWSLSSDRQGGSYNNFLIQPFLNYNFPQGFYINTVPIITANWKADNGQQWTVPLGMGIGKVFHLGRLPVNTQLGAYYNVVRPDDAAYWQLRVQVQLMFPK